jgi:hypothetical protein
MTTPKKLSLETFIRRYSSANRNEHEIVLAAVNKLDPESIAYAPAKRCLEAYKELEEILEASGFEL